MSDALDSSQPTQPETKKFDLNSLLPAKLPVSTSLGTLYVRRARASDWKHLENDDVQKLGKTAAQLLSSRVEDKRNYEPLADDDLSALLDEDFRSLVPVIAERCGWQELSVGAELGDLGSAVNAAKQAESENREKMLANMRQSIDSSYGFLSKSVLEKLQGQMVNLVDIRSALCGVNTDAIKSAMRATESYASSLKKSLADTNGIESGLRDLHATGIESPLTIKLPPLSMPPNPEETLLGRAALESAENSRNVAQKMDALVDILSGLNQTVIRDVLPAWFKQVDAGQESAKSKFIQAGKALSWTKWAVKASAVVTAAATWWQVTVAKDIDRENAEQQKRTEVLLRDQLSAQQKLFEQQTRDAAALREAIGGLKVAVPAVERKK